MKAKFREPISILEKEHRQEEEARKLHYGAGVFGIILAIFLPVMYWGRGRRFLTAADMLFRPFDLFDFIAELLKLAVALTGSILMVRAYSNRLERFRISIANQNLQDFLGRLEFRKEDAVKPKKN